MKIKITGQSVFMEFEHVAKNETSATKFVKQMMNINRGLALEHNPKPENARPRYQFRSHWVTGPKHNPKLDAWRERNRELRLTVQIVRV